MHSPKINPLTSPGASLGHRGSGPVTLRYTVLKVILHSFSQGSNRTDLLFPIAVTGWIAYPYLLY